MLFPKHSMLLFAQTLNITLNIDGNGRKSDQQTNIDRNKIHNTRPTCILVARVYVTKIVIRRQQTSQSY